MVPLGEPTIIDLRRALTAAARPGPDTPIQVRAFRAWVGEDRSEIAAMADAATAALATSGRSAGDAAALGYLEACGDDRAAVGAALDGGLEWLGQRSWFVPARPVTLEGDGVSVLGLALAAMRRPTAQGAEWLRRLASRSAASAGTTRWSRSLFVAAAAMLSGGQPFAFGPVAPCLRIALTDRGIATGVDSDVLHQSWRDVVAFVGDDVAEAAAVLAAAEHVVRASLPARLSQVGPGDVLRVLDGLRKSLRRWTWDTVPRTATSRVARWDVENEYHVQNLLWAVLAPLFPDIVDEAYTSPVGQKNPRVDIGLPGLGLVVEAKFMRPSMSFQKVIEEIAEDASLYLSDQRWRAVIPFVWDDTARTEEHATLVAGLTKLPGVAGAVVVARPSRMIRAAEET